LQTALVNTCIPTKEHLF